MLSLFSLTGLNARGSFLRTAVILALGYAAAGPAKADLVNGNFSGAPDPYQTVSAGSTAVPGWKIMYGSVYWVGDLWQGPPGGGDSVDLEGGSMGAIYQHASTVVGSYYQLSFYLAGDPLGDLGNKQLTVIAGGDSGHFTFDTVGQTTTNMGWTLETFNFIATSSSTLIAFINAGGSQFGPVIGGVGLVDPPLPTPEPGFLAPLALGLGGLCYAAFRRRRARFL